MRRLGSILFLAIVIGGCSAPTSSGSAVVTAHTSTPWPTEPISTPTPSDGALDHATGRADVLLRFDAGYSDYGLCELCGGWGSFQPAPEFTLYGDGTVIVRNTLAPTPPAEGPIIRAQPFMIGHLDQDRVQDILRFALVEGGLADARERYETSTDTDDPGFSAFIIRAGTVDKRIEIDGTPNPFDTLRDHLLDLTQRAGVKTEIFKSERYQGLLIEVGTWMDLGLLPDPPDTMIVSWPWQDIGPEDFTGPAAPDSGRRTMTRDEAAVLGLSENGGVVQRIYVRGPDGVTLYSFSLWPTLPDEMVPAA